MFFVLHLRGFTPRKQVLFSLPFLFALSLFGRRHSLCTLRACFGPSTSPFPSPSVSMIYRPQFFSCLKRRSRLPLIFGFGFPLFQPFLQPFFSSRFQVFGCPFAFLNTRFCFPSKSFHRSVVVSSSFPLFFFFFFLQAAYQTNAKPPNRSRFRVFFHLCLHGFSPSRSSVSRLPPFFVWFRQALLRASPIYLVDN